LKLIGEVLEEVDTVTRLTLSIGGWGGRCFLLLAHKAGKDWFAVQLFSEILEPGLAVARYTLAVGGGGRSN
jgi:hypothetical protein